MEADGIGKYLRKSLNSKNPITVRLMFELYIVENEYLSSKEAKQEYKDKEAGLMFTIPSTVPPLNAATKRLVERAEKESKKRK